MFRREKTVAAYDDGTNDDAGGQREWLHDGHRDDGHRQQQQQPQQQQQQRVVDQAAAAAILGRRPTADVRGRGGLLSRVRDGPPHGPRARVPLYMGTGTAVQAGGRSRTTAPEKHARQAGRRPPHARSHGMSQGRRPVVASRRWQQQGRDVARPMGGTCIYIDHYLNIIINNMTL